MSAFSVHRGRQRPSLSSLGHAIFCANFLSGPTGASSGKVEAYSLADSRFPRPQQWQANAFLGQFWPNCASAGNRTRVTSMATMYSATRPLMLCYVGWHCGNNDSLWFLVESCWNDHKTTIVAILPIDVINSNRKRHITSNDWCCNKSFVRTRRST